MHILLMKLRIIWSNVYVFWILLVFSMSMSCADLFCMVTLFIMLVHNMSAYNMRKKPVAWADQCPRLYSKELGVKFLVFVLCPIAIPKTCSVWFCISVSASKI